MSRPWVWLQLVIGWLPVGALFALLILTAHPHSSVGDAVAIALRMMLAGAALGFPVHRLARRLPWPHPMRVSFIAWHVGGAALYAVAFVAANSLIESVTRLQAVIVVGTGLGPFMILGVWLYVMIAGVAYATDATARAAQAEALAARAQLAALRSQLNPHFLFNALHTVVQLIPRDPARASDAAEQVAALLRTTLEADRDVVSLDEELAFVRRYLAVERIRFGDRLIVTEAVDADARDALVPAFALQTLVENAVRHGAAPRVEATTITIAATRTAHDVILSVGDTGDGAGADALARGGTGLRRLRERLGVLYGTRARLDVSPAGQPGFRATITLPLAHDE